MGCVDRDVLRQRDRLEIAVLPQLEVVGGEIGDEVAVLVGDHRVDANDIDAYTKPRRLGRLRRSLGAREPSRRQNRNREEEEPHPLISFAPSCLRAFVIVETARVRKLITRPALSHYLAGVPLELVLAVAVGIGDAGRIRITRHTFEGQRTDRLRVRGWQVPAYPLTGSVSDVAVQRILVRQGVSRDLASLLLDDIRDAVAHFDKHPQQVPMSKEEASGFSHL